jgi:hypothetical protein
VEAESFITSAEFLEATFGLIDFLDPGLGTVESMFELGLEGF